MKKYWNGQQHFECQLVTLWNAAIYYGIKVPERYGPEYQADCEKACAIIGSVIDKEHVIQKLRLKAIRGKLKWRWVKRNLPVEFTIYSHRGNHSILAIEVRKKSLIVLNHFKGFNCRLSWKVIKKMHNQHTVPIKWKRVDKE